MTGASISTAPALVAVARIRRITAVLENGKELDTDDRQWCASAFREYLDGAALGLTLDNAVGVAPRPYERPWFEMEALAERERLILELAVYVPAPSCSGQAKAMASLAVGYATNGWLRERDLVEPPNRHNGRPEEVLWHLHQCGASWPLGWRRIFESLQKKHVAAANSLDALSAHSTGDDDNDRRKVSAQSRR